MNEFMEQLNALRDAKASNTTDVIDRQDEIMRKQAVIDILTRYRDSWQGEYYKPFRMAMDEVNALPSAERKGRWINKGDYAICSNCGVHSGTQFDGVEPIPLKTNFCPNCGADMRGEE